MTAMLNQLEFYDTGQNKAKTSTDDAAEPAAGNRIGVVQHDIHRYDEAADGATENVMSTLKSFILKVGLFDGASTEPLASEDGLQLTAHLIYENGLVVEDLSATLEPPLLGGNGAILQDGVAQFKLKITVLSTLCRGNLFRVQVSCAERPDLCVITAPMRTITKLRRGPALKDKASAKAPTSPLLSGLKRGLELDASMGFFLDDLESGFGLSSACGHSIDALWDEVNSNGSLLLELQKQQRTLFRELRELREKTG